MLKETQICLRELLLLESVVVTAVFSAAQINNTTIDLSRSRPLRARSKQTMPIYNFSLH
jgi:hypothetical protein